MRKTRPSALAVLRLITKIKLVWVFQPDALADFLTPFQYLVDVIGAAAPIQDRESLLHMPLTHQLPRTLEHISIAGRRNFVAYKLAIRAAWAEYCRITQYDQCARLAFNTCERAGSNSCGPLTVRMSYQSPNPNYLIASCVSR